MMQFLEVRRELRIAKTQLGQQRNIETEEVNLLTYFKILSDKNAIVLLLRV